MNDTAPKDDRLDAVADAFLEGDTEGSVTLKNFRERYGAKEASHQQARIRHETRKFLAMYDAATRFPLKRPR